MSAARGGLTPGQRLSRLGPLGLGMVALVAGVAGGLLRAGLDVPAPDAAAWHGALMTGAFFGTVIGIERAVALGGGLAFAGPVLSGLAGVALVAGFPTTGAWLLAAGSAGLARASLRVLSRQRAPHTWLLLVAALGWLSGNLLFAGGLPPDALNPWWFGFLAVTIAAERLELTRLMPRRPAAQPLLWMIVTAMGLTALAVTLATLPDGHALRAPWITREAAGIAWGATLVALAGWLAVFDIARRTIRTEGVARYAAACLLGGYAWLAVSGLAWGMAALEGGPWRDLALHALGLGFVVSMVMGHAPIILPAIARVPLRFSGAFWLPLALLHASLLLRFAPVAGLEAGRAPGAALNALALGVFALTVVRGLLSGRPAAPRPSAPRRSPPVPRPPAGPAGQAPSGRSGR